MCEKKSEIKRRRWTDRARGKERRVRGASELLYRYRARKRQRRKRAREQSERARERIVEREQFVA